MRLLLLRLAGLLVEPGKQDGPAGLLQACRFLVGRGDQAGGGRLDDLRDPYRR